MSKRKKSKPRKPAPRKPPIVKKVVLPAAGVVRVAVPKGVVPVVAVDPVRRVVEIVPVPAAKVAPKRESWWTTFFG